MVALVLSHKYARGQFKKEKQVADIQKEKATLDNKPQVHHSASTKHGSPNYGSRKWIVWLLIAITVMILTVILFKHKEKDKAQAPDEATIPHIKVAGAKRGEIGSYIEALGNVTPLATVNLYSQVTGRVEAVHYMEGQVVHRGDSLIDIDPLPYEAQLEEAEGALQRDKASLQQAEMDLTRYQQATAGDAIARQTYEDQIQTVVQYKGTVRNDAGQVKYAQVQLSYCHLVSPINGRVGLRLVDPGNTIFSGGSNPIVVVTQMQPITVVFNVAEDYLSQVHDEIIRRGRLRVDAFDRSQMAKIATGKLLTLDNQVDTSTGTVRFRAQFDNSDLALFPNQFVNARLLVKTLHNVILVPGSAVQHNGAQAFVYVVNGDMANLRPVVELGSEGDSSAVSGLDDGNVVAVTGFDKLQDGTHVVVESPIPLGAAVPPQQNGVGQ
jgi:multidrug efflux system membrane fusion protein